MQFGVSYFGVRNPQHFQRDLEEIARLGFTSIIFTFSEEDHRFYQGSLTEFVRRTHQQGLKACIDPWGVCGVFGGEAFSDRGAWDLEGQQRRSDGRSATRHRRCALDAKSAGIRKHLGRYGCRLPRVRQLIRVLRLALIEREQRVARLPELLAGDLQVAGPVAAEQVDIARRRHVGRDVG